MRYPAFSVSISRTYGNAFGISCRISLSSSYQPMRGVDFTLHLTNPVGKGDIRAGFDENLDDNKTMMRLSPDGLEETSGTQTNRLAFVYSERVRLYLFSYCTSPSSATYESTAAMMEEGVIVDRFPPIVFRFASSKRSGKDV